MKFYFAPNTISIAAAIMLEEAGLEYDPVEISFAEAEQTKPAYHKINPKGRVPALVTDAGILTETGAILRYLAEISGKDMLQPHPWDSAFADSVMYYLASTMHVNHAHKMRGSRWADQESSWKDMTAKVQETMTSSCAYVEAECLKGPYVMGENFSIADPYLLITLCFARSDGVDFAPFPKIQSFLEAMEARRSVRTMRDRKWLTT